LSKETPDVQSAEFLKLLVSSYSRPAVATDADGRMLKGIGARDRQIRQLSHELFEMKILVAALIALLAQEKRLDSFALAEKLDELRTRFEHWELGGIPDNDSE
jgi:hypothetical protein